MIIVNKQFIELKKKKKASQPVRRGGKNRLLYKRLFTLTIIGLRYWMMEEEGV